MPIFEARLLFALGIIRFVLGLSDNKHLILLFPVTMCLVTCDTRGVTSDNVMITPGPGSWQIFDRVVSSSYHHPDNDPATMPQILTSHLIMEHCNRSEVAVEA